ncbi:restriction endonuclease subunit S [Aliivibrio sp. S4TY2]|uniref:restriction endonuclease subunit S n=1 Tax=unclassified Aliivibrio TaxID=2645654 RepID=UPI002378DC13|nr:MULTISPECIES: restriction endonuclease subunit S [unclassified Aliivibrio]MDD9158297.1 restriction endonuclease subunit S [Aliivibrio sp. S4TY2]MDD9162212.1 restriction endonuclease subunit S [Aliivibrio sp. S4TY1]MDD9166219.1 restriction endonuclease subunit S [Aliivibrio sp. S4MY2]MDD9170248.1 restriction endonuclease subunit S [Aliivibrio sp. S4MY4]MDD9187299.1 restriction endonuclease subunit S [Aliivibrio sp. S4MY3]
MGSEWKSGVLGDLITSGNAILQTGPFGTALKAEEYSSHGVPLISVREIREGFIQIEDITPKVDCCVTTRLPKFVLELGDIVFARKGGIERNALITEREKGWFIGSDGIYLRLSDKFDSTYFSYVMRSPHVKTWLIKNCEGTTMPSLNQKILARIPIFLPPKIEQQKISDLLCHFDKKIALNRQINQTLEQMAQTLFKSWFVDFDPVIDNALDAIASGQDIEIPESLTKRFEARKAVRESEGFEPLPADIRQLFPCEFEESELGFVPKGWGYKPAQDIASISIGKTPPRKETEWFSDVKAKNVTWISIRDMGNCGVFTQESNEYLVPEAISKFNVKVIPKDSVILSFKMTLGRVSIASTELATNEAIAHFVNPKFGINKEYLYSYLMTFNYDSLGSTSSIATAVNSKLIKQLPVLVPDSSILDTYFERVTGIFEKLQSVDCEVSTLINLRDTLLPKLISGELRLDSLQGEALQQAVSAE